jgi:hypothetical protein
MTSILQHYDANTLHKLPSVRVNWHSVEGLAGWSFAFVVHQVKVNSSYSINKRFHHTRLRDGMGEELRIGRVVVEVYSNKGAREARILRVGPKGLFEEDTRHRYQTKDRRGFIALVDAVTDALEQDIDELLERQDNPGIKGREEAVGAELKVKVKSPHEDSVQAAPMPKREYSREFANPEALLQGIADGLEDPAHHRVVVSCLEVTFYDDEGEEVFVGSVGQAISYIVNNITWGVDGSWADATEAQVRVL